MASQQKDLGPIRERIHEIIFEADTKEGKIFDIILLIIIAASVIAVMLESVESIETKHTKLFGVLEWFFTIFFTIEYALRIYCVNMPRKYIFSFYGIIDFLAILPSYISLFLSGSHFFVVIRALRLLRVFRIFKLGQFMKESAVIMAALKSSWNKISVFLFFITIAVTIIGSVMYIVETDSDGGFTSIPKSIYWAIVTLTTVGYGDIAPQTELGQFLASVVMILGYAVIAVPTGIVSAEMVHQVKVQNNTQVCQNCHADNHQDDAYYCRVCAHSLNKK